MDGADSGAGKGTDPGNSPGYDWCWACWGMPDGGIAYCPPRWT